MTYCYKCGRELVIPPTGRPPRYCSVGCRRAVEYEVRRIERALDRLEEQRERVALDTYGSPKHRASKIQSLDALIAQAEDRLRDLLDDTTGEEPAA